VTCGFIGGRALSAIPLYAAKLTHPLAVAQRRSATYYIVGGNSLSL
jgi:hypothetical protein